MKRTALLIVIALFLTACIVAVSYAVCYGSSYTVEYADLDIKEYDFDGKIFTVKVSADADGEYLYKVLATQSGEEGELVLTFRGGKQPSRAQTPDKKTATFSVEVPAGTKRIVCDGMTVYTIN